MKFWNAFIRIISLGALILYIACGSVSKQPETSATYADKNSEISTSMAQNNINHHPENYLMRWYDSQDPNKARGLPLGEARDVPLAETRGLPLGKTRGVPLGEARDVPLAKTRGVALVIHGLNLRPSKMESIINNLTDTGIDTLNLSLRGHGENYDHHAHKDPARARLETFKSVSYELWKSEIFTAYAAARSRSVEKDVPLFFIGFSMGGLMGTDLLASGPDIQFDKMVLFAPAIKMHARNNIIRVLSPFPRLTIPSYTLASYQSNSGTPMAGYNALFESHKNFSDHAGPSVNVPTLVFIDQKDEMVSYNRLKQMVQDENLDQWQLYIVDKESTEEPAKVHHLIIDEPSTGEEVWRNMMQAMIVHLYN